MSKIETLISELCASGVEYFTLAELGNFYGGLTGKSKNDFVDGNCKYITYKNIYNNPALDLNICDYVKVQDNERQNAVKYGDVLFTGSSETADECGLSSVVVQRVEDPIYVNSFCFIFRFNNSDIILPGFAKHLFRSKSLREQIKKTASGVTRYNVSKKLMEKVSIPVPPLPVQEEIVRILDNFSMLEAELEAELEARKKQYEHYRNQMLSFDEGGNHAQVKWKKLGDITKVQRGKRLTTKELLEDGKYPVFHGGLKPLGYYSNKNREHDTVMVINVGASAGTVGFSDIDFWSSDGCFCLAKTPLMKDKFLYYFLMTQEHRLKARVRKAGIPTLDNSVVENLFVPIIPITEQEQIISILDKFNALINNISVGLPAEIAARRKQYEYYRNKLLDFKKAE